MPENANEFSWTDHYPRALNSVYTTSEPNKPIALYNGAIEAGEGDTASKFQGNIELTWQPRYAVELQVSGNDTMDLFSRARSQITVPARGVSASGLWTEISSSLLEEIVFTRAENLSEVMFHLPNFFDYHGERIAYSDSRVGSGRLRLKSDNWCVIVDEIDGAIKKVKATGGYVLSHIGQIERIGGIAFSSDDVAPVLEALTYLFWFAKGRYTSPLLAVGYGVDGHRK